MYTSRDELIKLICNEFGLNAVDASEYFGYPSDGIWICDDICIEETGYYNYGESTFDDENIFNVFLNIHGWYAEAYDTETIMIYKF